MIPPVHLLLAEDDGFELLFGYGAVVAEGEHDLDPVAVGKSKVLFEIVHEGIVLEVPHFELDNGAHGVETRLPRQRKFVFDLFCHLFVVVFLPHGDAVHAVGGIPVESADPRLRVIPLPRPFLAPLFFHITFPPCGKSR